jgi:hypothetical protein
MLIISHVDADNFKLHLMNLKLYKKKLNNYFKKFAVSKEMAEVWKIIIGCRLLRDIYIDFKLNTKGYKKKCIINVIEEKSGQFKKCNFSSISKIFLCRRNLEILSKIEKFANSKKIRVGYSVRDEIPRTLKLYMIFDKGLVFEKELTQLIHGLGFDFIKLPNQQGLSLGIEFQGDDINFAFYEFYQGLPKEYLKNKSIKNFLKGMHYNKDTYYLCEKKYSSEGRPMYSKITKIYNRYHRFELIVKDIKIAMGEKIFSKINQDFEDYIIDSLCLRIEDNVRNTYVIPRGCSNRSFK